MLFVGVNLLFTGIDVVLAHSINSYIPVYECIPIIYFPLGFGFHLSADLAGTGAISLERILAFAPVLAPLLFCDLGMLGLLVVAQEKE